jgi:hypothetical protein
VNLGELMEQARIRLQDIKAGNLWSDPELTMFINAAQREACRRARLIVDSTTDEITLITLQADTATYDLDPRIIFIRRAKLIGTSPTLFRVSYKDLDVQAPDWEDETDTPRAYVPDMDENTFRPYPTPIAAGEVRLTVIREPLVDMANDVDVPEIKPRYLMSMMEWCYYLAYSKQDAETKDDAKAAAALAIFEGEFGKKSTAIDEVWQNREHGYMEPEGNF